MDRPFLSGGMAVAEDGDGDGMSTPPSGHRGGASPDTTTDAVSGLAAQLSGMSMTVRGLEDKVAELKITVHRVKEEMTALLGEIDQARNAVRSIGQDEHGGVFLSTATTPETPSVGHATSFVIDSVTHSPTEARLKEIIAGGARKYPCRPNNLGLRLFDPVTIVDLRSPNFFSGYVCPTRHNKKRVCCRNNTRIC